MRRVIQRRLCKSRRGFTIVEILVAIAIIAIIGTMATGAAIRSIRQARSRRIEAMCKILELGLSNYNALHGKWPYDFSINKRDAEDSSGRVYQTFQGQANIEVFRELFAEAKRNRSLVDTAAIMSQTKQGRLTVREAFDRGVELGGIGYPDPSNSSIFRFFKVRYNFNTDSIRVLKDDKDETVDDE